MLAAANRAAERLRADGTGVTVWDVRSCWPLDDAMLADAARHERIVTIEDGLRAGGVGMSIADRLRILAPSVVVDVLGLPTEFIAQANADRILARYGLDADGIVAAVTAR
jgi:1-deoxy-D-xylulose-5-phosphate synthase